MGGTHEKTFGLRGLRHKRVILGMDLPKDFHHKLNSTHYQSMVSGEGIPVAGKHLHVEHNGLCLRGSQATFDLGWEDPTGAIAKRQFTIWFRNRIDREDIDTSLYTSIVEKELVAVMIRSIRLYRTTCDEFKGKDFLEICCWSCVCANAQGQQAGTQPVWWRATIVKVVKDPGTWVSYSEFHKVYNDHRVIDLNLKERMTDDLLPRVMSSKRSKSVRDVAIWQRAKNAPAPPILIFTTIDAPKK